MATLVKSKKVKAVGKLTPVNDMRVALYVRVSTVVQANEGHSIDAQLKQLREYCSIKGWNNAIEFVDAGISGKDTHRNAFSEMVELIKERKFDCVVATKLDRVARNTKDFLQTVDLFEHYNCNTILLKENFDTTTPHGKFALTIFAALAELEASMITERVTMGKVENAAKGGYNGAVVPYGYDLVGGELIPNGDATIVERIFKEFVNGRSLNAIATGLNVDGILSPKSSKWYHATVKYIIDNGCYAGIAQYDGQSVPASRNAIVSMDVHLAAIERLKVLSKGNPNFGKSKE